VPYGSAATDVDCQCEQENVGIRESGSPPTRSESSNRKRDVTPAKFSAGMVVLRRFAGVWRCLMLRAFRNWDFPKGEVEAGESPLAAARREVKEETSLTALDLRGGGDFCETEPYRGGKIARYYLAESPHGEVALPFSPELGRPEHHEYRWVGFPEAKKLAPARLQPIIAWAESFSAGRPPPTACDAHGK
jgi:bis(5'-nucleosidyl)-tetraphosphatase